MFVGAIRRISRSRNDGTCFLCANCVRCGFLPISRATLGDLALGTVGPRTYTMLGDAAGSGRGAAAGRGPPASQSVARAGGLGSAEVAGFGWAEFFQLSGSLPSFLGWWVGWWGGDFASWSESQGGRRVHPISGCCLVSSLSSSLSMRMCRGLSTQFCHGSAPLVYDATLYENQIQGTGAKGLEFTTLEVRIARGSCL